MKVASMILLMLLVFQLSAFGGRCTGSSNCRACTTCSSCRHCNGGGGSCGVCGGGSMGGIFGKIIIGAVVVGILYSIAGGSKKK